MPLDSDVANADSQLHVEFYENKSDSYKGQPFIRIIVPGDKTTVIDQPVREDHKQRFPRQWLYFQMNNSGGNIPGTPLAEWHRDEPEAFNSGQLEEMLILKFQVVEQIASASDSQLQRVGMGAVGLRDRARKYLQRRNTSANADEFENLKAQVAMLTQALKNKPQEAVPPKRMKVKADGLHDAPTGAAGHE